MTAALYKHIVDELRRARLAKGWTQEQLGKEVGMVQEAISRFEKGDMAIRVRTLIRIAVALDKKIEIV